jgi:DNA-binding transcriptional LysR family regulator
METDRLKQFCAVVETQSLTKACDIVGLTLSGLSRSLKILQHELNQELIKQHGRGVIITDQGLVLYKKAKQVLEQINDLKTNHPTSDFIKIGCLEVFTYNFLGHIVKSIDFQKTEILELAPGNLETKVALSEIDFGFTYLPFGVESVEHLPIASFQLSAFVKQNSFKNIQVDKIPFIVPSSSLGLTQLNTKDRDGWPEEYWERPISAKVNLLSTAIDLCAQGVGAVFMPKFVGAEYNNRSNLDKKLQEIPLPSISALKRKIYLVKRNAAEENKIIKNITTSVRKSLSTNQLG